MKLRDYIAEQPRGTTAALAEYCECTPASINQWKGGKIHPSHDKVVKIVAYTNGVVPAWELVPLKYGICDDPTQIKLRRGLAINTRPRV